MKSRRIDGVIAYSSILVIVLVLVYLLIRPLIYLLGLCSALDAQCKYITTLFYNPVVYWLLVAGLVFSLGRYVIGRLKRSRYLKTFSAYKYDDVRLSKIIDGLDYEFKVFVSEKKQPVAFYSGIFRKALYLSKGAIIYLDESELEALVLHEVAHMFNNDALHLSIARLLSDLFFYLPGIRMIYNRWEAQKEYFADGLAAKEVGGSGFVINALLKVSHLRLSTSRSVASFSSGKTDVLKRIKKLQGKKVRHNLSRAVLVITMLVILFVGISARVSSTSIDESGCPMHLPVEVNHVCTS